MNVKLSLEQRQRAEQLVDACVNDEDALRRLAYELIEHRDVLREMLADPACDAWSADLCARIDVLTDEDVAK